MRAELIREVADISNHAWRCRRVKDDQRNPRISALDEIRQAEKA